MFVEVETIIGHLKDLHFFNVIFKSNEEMTNSGYIYSSLQNSSIILRILIEGVYREDGKKKCLMLEVNQLNKTLVVTVTKMPPL